MKIRTEFKNFINYLHSDVLDFEKMEEDGMMGTYFAAMQFVSEVAGNISYSPFYKEDIEIMVTLSTGSYTSEDLGEMMEISIQKMNLKVTKLVNLGYAYRTKVKQRSYFNLSPYGRKILDDYISDPKSPLYE